MCFFYRLHCPYVFLPTVYFSGFSSLNKNTELPFSISCVEANLWAVKGMVSALLSVSVDWKHDPSAKGDRETGDGGQRRGAVSSSAYWRIYLIYQRNKTRKHLATNFNKKYAGPK